MRYYNNQIKELEIAIEKRTGSVRAILAKLKSFSNYLILEPNINGMGIDLKKVINDLTK